MRMFVSSGWLPLSIAILFGVLGTISMKLSHGLRHIRPSICVVIFYVTSFIALTFAMQYLELSMVYAVWSGAGTVLVALVGFFYFNETISIKKIFFLSLIVFGVIGIHLSDNVF